MAKKKAVITNYLETFTDEQKALAGTYDQINVRRYDDEGIEVEKKYVQTAEEAEAIKTEWDNLDKS